MKEINEIKIPEGVESISVTQHDDKIVIEFIPEKPKFKEGDFVYEDGRIMIVKSYPNMYHANAYPEFSTIVCYNDWYGEDFSSPTFRYATEEERQILIEAMRKDGKQWNADKKCIEDIQKRKFKAGDKVKIKDGISSETHRHVDPRFTEPMDEFIGKKLTVEKYNSMGFVITDADYFGYNFAEDWLEPYEELKKGDLVIFWDDDKRYAALRFYEKSNENEGRIWHKDIRGFIWANAIKFESKEQYEKVLRGEI